MTKEIVRAPTCTEELATSPLPSLMTTTIIHSFSNMQLTDKLHTINVQKSMCNPLSISLCCRLGVVYCHIYSIVSQKMNLMGGFSPEVECPNLKFHFSMQDSNPLSYTSLQIFSHSCSNTFNIYQLLSTH